MCEMAETEITSAAKSHIRHAIAAVDMRGWHGEGSAGFVLNRGKGVLGSSKKQSILPENAARMPALQPQ